MNAVKNAMSKTLSHAKLTPHRSATRGHSDHGWLNTYHSFSFADWYDPRFTHFGSLRVLNEDRVKPGTGFPTHPHANFEIFSYILSGELTHRDSMLQKGSEGGQSDKFYKMNRGDVQFTTGGTGIAHSEFNEHRKDTVHFLQIWAIPWKRGLPPALSHPQLSRGGQEEGNKFEWIVGANATDNPKRKVFVHVPMTKGGKAKVRLDGREEVYSEGDGAFIDNLRAGDKLSVESVGDADAEVIVLDSE
ncbi:RmlC-like cupin domain-containing protein [Apiospora arundinis]